MQKASTADLFRRMSFFSKILNSILFYHPKLVSLQLTNLSYQTTIFQMISHLHSIKLSISSFLCTIGKIKALDCKRVVSERENGPARQRKPRTAWVLTGLVAPDIAKPGFYRFTLFASARWSKNLRIISTQFKSR